MVSEEKHCTWAWKQPNQIGVMLMATVRIQVIKVYDVQVGGDDPISAAYDLQTTEIEERGRFVDASTDHAELIESE